MLHLSDEHGVDCVQHLRGQVAFALWDAPRRRLLRARDRLGQKPLYYSIVAGRLYFASELRALLSALPQEPEIDLQAIADEKANIDQIVATLGLKEMTQGTLIRKLCTYTAPNPTRRAIYLLVHERQEGLTASEVACLIHL